MSSAILVCMHGQAAEEIIKSVEMIMGEQENVGFVNFHPGENTEDLMDKYQQEMMQLDCSKGVLVMVDLFGGSPFNAISQLALVDSEIEVIAGVNMPMLLESLISRNSKDLTQLVKDAEEIGKEGIRILTKISIDDEDDMGDDL